MLESSTKAPENRIHLFDPVGLINDGNYGGYRSSNYAVRPTRRPPSKSYSNFEDVNTSNNNNNGGLRPYDGFPDVANNNNAINLRPYDSFTDHKSNNNAGLRSYESFSMETNGGGIRSFEHTIVEDRSSLGGIRFGVDNNMSNNNSVVDDEGDVSTPRLWNNKPSSSPTSPKGLESPKSYFLPTSPKSPMHHSSNKPPLMGSSPLHPSISVNKPLNLNQSPLQHYHQNMSPSSRTQAIAKGRRELMEMVRDLPESFYELSLKDIVEQKAEMEVQKEIDIPEEKKTIKETSANTSSKPKEAKKGKKSSKKVKKSESKKKMVRSKSVDNGKFLLRTSVFPIFSSSKKNKKNLGPSNSFKITPLPKPQPPTSSGSLKVAQKDWWRRKSCISSESDDTTGLSSKSASSGSSSSSSRSSSSNGRRSNRFLPSCCLFNGRRIRGKK